MTNIVLLMAGAAIYAAGILTGHFMPRRRAVAQDPATCVCGHPYTTRDAKTGRCTAEVQREHYLRSGARNGWEWVACPCVDHASPEQRIQAWTPRQVTEAER